MLDNKSLNLILFFACVTLLVALLCVLIIALVYKYQKKRIDYIQEIDKLKNAYANTLLQSQLEIQEQTFQNIAREIHDNIGQKLTLAKLYLNILSNNELNTNVPQINSSLQLISESISELSDLSRSMSKDYIISNGLVKAIESEVLMLNKTGVFTAELILFGDEVFLDENSELVVFRIVQECINNFVKHAKGSSISIELRYLSSELILKIRDDGIGLTVTDKYGTGMINMRKRAELLKGSFHARQIDRGTMIEVRIPISLKTKGENGKSFFS